MTERGLSERRALTVLGMSASALRYVPAPTGMPRFGRASWRWPIGIGAMASA
jgi:hypothetical protein